MKDMDTIIYKIEVNGEILSLSNMFARAEGKEIFLERCKLMYETVENARIQYEKKFTK